MSDSSAKTAAVRYELVAEAVQDPHTTDPIVVVRKALRGRVGRAALLATLFGITGAVLGYLAVPPVYESTGLVRVAASLPAVLYEEANAQFNEPFEAFAESQEAQIVSREVLQAAARDPQLQQLDWPTGDAGIHMLEDSLNVSRERGHQFMYVSVQHNDPPVAQAAVNAVLTAYAEQFSTNSALGPGDIERLLLQREDDLRQQLQSLREQSLAVSGQYGIEAVRQMHAEKIEQLTTIDQKLTEIDRAIAAISDSINSPGDAADTQTVQNLLNSIASEQSENRAALRQQEQTLVAEIESWKQHYGPGHPMLREFNRQLDVVRLRLDMLASAPLSYGGGRNSAQDTLDNLLNIEQTYIAMREVVVAEASELGNKHASLAGISEHIAEVQQRLSETRRRLDEIRVENSRPASSRVTVTAMGDYPLAPIKDRRQGLAAAGGLFGMLLGGAIVVFVGLIDQRCRYVDQLAQCAPSTPILCRIPDLSGNDERETARSAVAIHQLRHTLQISHDEQPCKVVTVTSSGPGDGKTSLALALGGSFAGSGSRTLVIDADPQHRALSNLLGIDSMPGLYDAVRGEQHSGEIVRTDTENLWVMPTGSVAGAHAAQLSQQNFRWLLDAVAERFDTVIIDTGPVATSIEASACCSVADYVLLMVSRDQRSRLVRDAVDRARHCTAGQVGLVFNRAVSGDVRLVDEQPTALRRDITALVPGAIPQRGTTVGRIGRTPADAAGERLERAA